jgi:hypothetical protein
MTAEDFKSICEEIEESWEGLTTICRRHGYNSRTPFHNFKKDNANLENRYARAREKQLDYLEELLREVSFNEDRDRDVIDKVNVGGNAVARDRLKADTLKFILSKLRAGVYGNKVEVTNIGEPRIFNIDYSDGI